MRKRWMIWGACLVIWTVFLLLPRSQFEGSPLDELSTRSRYLIAKFLHIIMYAVLAILSGWLRVPARYRWMLLFVLMSHAGLSELFQDFVPGRIGRVSDVGLDHLGILIGILISWRWWTLE